MNRISMMAVYLSIFTLIVFLSVTKAESFDAEAISQVSKMIAEWNLMNEDKSETQVEPQVYISSSLRGMTEKGSGEGVRVLSGLSSLIDMKYVPWELRDVAHELNQRYERNIYVVIDRSIAKAGQTEVTQPVYRLPNSIGGSEVLGPARIAIIKINPDKIWDGLTYGQVLAHEFEHARGALSWNYRGSEVAPTKAELNYISQVNTKISSNPLRLSMGKVYDVGSRELSNTVVIPVGKVSLRDPFYNFTQNWHLSQVPDVSTLRLPDSYFNRPAAGDFNTRIGMSSYNIGAVKISPPITSTTNYPPPNILFSMPKIPTYSTYSIPRMSTYTPMPTYTPTIPSYSSGRKY